MTRYRVVQWATGNIGQRALRAVLDRETFELVGVHAFSSEKVGRDAGALAGVASVGVLATDDVDALIGTAPDCVIYTPHFIDYALVDRLLRAGINVISTMNIQHLESLVDVVWKITGVRQRETVPDGLLSRADEIEIVDITPTELRQRLAEGKVYKQIAHELTLSTSTVRTHLHNIYGKLGAVDRAQAVLIATERGWL